MIGANLEQKLQPQEAEILASRQRTPEVPHEMLLRDKTTDEGTLTDSASARILPQETASSGRAPESEPSNS
jgi:hypothetical protein